VRRARGSAPGLRPASGLAPAPLLVIGAVASVQSGAAIATKLFPQVGPAGTVFLRLVLAAVMLLAVARPSARGRRRGDLLLAVAFGLVLAGMNATFYEALSRIPLGIAVTFEFVGPLALAVVGSRRRLDLLWVALAAIGVALLTAGGPHVDVVGVVLALVAGGFWAAYILLSQRVGAVFPGASGLALALAVGAVGMAPFGIAAGGSALLHPSVFARGAAVALLSSAVPYSLELFALRRLRASVFGVLMSLEPAFGAVSGLLFLGQQLRLREWVAIGCVMAASVGATRNARREDQPIEPGATPSQVAAV
jgi:inner membrane transporter RhtA